MLRIFATGAPILFVLEADDASPFGGIAVFTTIVTI